MITPELGAEYGQKVAEIYRDAELRILARISAALGVGTDAPDWNVRALAQVQQVRKITLEELRKASPEAAAMIRASLAEAYGLGGLAVFDDVGAALPLIEGMPQAQRAAVGALATELTTAINSATPGILRAVDDVYREVVADAIGSRLTGGEFQREAVQRSLQRFLGDGIKTVQTGRGRMGIGDYVHMAVRTGTTRASLQGQFDTMSANGLDLIIVSPGPRACSICDRWARLILTTNTTTKRKPDTSLATGRAVAVRVDGTLAEARLAGVFHPNCFPSFVPVASPTGIVGGDSRWFEGEVVVIHTAAGREITVTPNHPILTAEGWIEAGALHEGSNLVSYGGDSGDGQGVVSGAPDHQYVETPIGEVYEALRQSSHTVTTHVPGSAEQFHGDGIVNSEVEIVLSDRLLDAEGNPTSFKGAAQHRLALASADAGSFLAERAAFEVSLSALHAAHGVMGGEGELSAFLGGGLSHAEEHGIGAVANGDAGSFEPVADDGAANAEGGRKLLAALAGLVALDQVSHVERRDFRGHVFNLQTGSGWYTANSIVVHNCRCSSKTYLPGITEPSELQRPAWDQEGYEAQSRQRQIELGIRQAKTSQAIAITPEGRARAAARVKDGQAVMRAHLAENTYLKRQSSREQLRG